MVPPATEEYVDDDLITCLLATVVDFQTQTTAVERALRHYQEHRFSEVRTLGDLEDCFDRLPDSKAGNETLAEWLFGYRLWTRAGLLRSLVRYLRAEGIDDFDGLQAWAVRSDFRRDFEGRVQYRAEGRTYGLGAAVYNWLVMRLGVETVKPDVRLRRFVEGAVRRRVSDSEIIEAITEAARRLGLSPRQLDWAIWQAGRQDAGSPRWNDEPVFERFTDRARLVLVLAQEEALLLRHSFIGTEHILLGLIHEGEGLAANALESLGISLEVTREKVEETIGPARSAPTDGSPPFTPRAKKVLELSLREALQLGHNYIGTEHILLGLVREGEGVGAEILVGLGGDLPRVRQQVIQLLSGHEDRVGSTGPRRPGPVARLRRTESVPVPIGDGWTVQVVRGGRTPAAFADAYEAMASLVTGLGVDLDDQRIAVTSVETNEGPGLRLVVSYETADDSVASPRTRREDASADEPPV